MFTIEQLQSAHSKVKSGADFPAYIRAIKELGVTRYETYVGDGHTDYHGTYGHLTQVPAKQPPQVIADAVDGGTFKTELLAHQQGKTDYPTFIAMCAATGVEKWEISMERMTCTYFDKEGREVLSEKIPH